MIDSLDYQPKYSSIESILFTLKSSKFGPFQLKIQISCLWYLQSKYLFNPAKVGLCVYMGKFKFKYYLWKFHFKVWSLSFLLTVLMYIKINVSYNTRSLAVNSVFWLKFDPLYHIRFRPYMLISFYINHIKNFR